MKAQIPILEFWQLTPQETFWMIEAYLWQQKQIQRGQIRQAWLTAALSRTKRLPKLSQLLIEPARKLEGEELERRRQEFKEMTARVDLEALNNMRSKL